MTLTVDRVLVMIYAKLTKVERQIEQGDYSSTLYYDRLIGARDALREIIDEVEAKEAVRP